MPSSPRWSASWSPSLGVPLVHVTHSVAEARLLAEQGVRIERGQVIACGATGDVLAHVASASLEE